jgi:CheY-like chemotaxis protein
VPKKILAIDDEPHIRQIIEMKLQTAGYDVRTATNAVRGLEIAREFRPDLIICDQNTPGGMTGVDLARVVRKDAELANTPFILLTGSVALTQPLADALAGESSVRLVTKPFSPRQLMKTIAEML